MNNDEYHEKYKKYVIKNKLGGGLSAFAKSAVKAIQTVKKVSKDAINIVRKKALKGIIEIKKVLNNKDTKDLLKELTIEKEHKEIIEIVEEIEKILKIENTKELVEKRRNFVKLLIRFNNLIQKFPEEIVSNKVKDNIATVTEFANELIPKDKWNILEKEVEIEKNKN